MRMRMFSKSKIHQSIVLTKGKQSGNTGHFRSNFKIQNMASGSSDFVLTKISSMLLWQLLTQICFRMMRNRIQKQIHVLKICHQKKGETSNENFIINRKPPEVFCKTSVHSCKFLSIHRTPVLESLFNKAAFLIKFIKKKLQHRCFSVNIAKFL